MGERQENDVVDVTSDGVVELHPARRGRFDCKGGSLDHVIRSCQSRFPRVRLERPDDNHDDNDDQQPGRYFVDQPKEAAGMAVAVLGEGAP